MRPPIPRGPARAHLLNLATLGDRAAHVDGGARRREMANSAAKERVKKNAVLMQKYFRVIMACNVRAVRPRRDRAAQTPSCTPAAQGVYIGYRVILLWSTFSNWHMAGFGAMLAAYAALGGTVLSRGMEMWSGANARARGQQGGL